MASAADLAWARRRARAETLSRGTKQKETERALGSGEARRRQIWRGAGSGGWRRRSVVAITGGTTARRKEEKGGGGAHPRRKQTAAALGFEGGRLDLGFEAAKERERPGREINRGPIRVASGKSVESWRGGAAGSRTIGGPHVRRPCERARTSGAFGPTLAAGKESGRLGPWAKERRVAVAWRERDVLGESPNEKGFQIVFY